MTDLKTLYEELTFKNITTYIQSGNVIFKNQNAKDLSQKIEKKIFEKYNFNVPVIIRTIDEMQVLINKNPFLKEKNIDLDKLHITYLAENPGLENIENLKKYNYQPDRFFISAKEVYLFCPNGYWRTKLTTNFFENKLKMPASTRNWRTTNELLKIMKSY